MPIGQIGNIGSFIIDNGELISVRYICGVKVTEIDKIAARSQIQVTGITADKLSLSLRFNPAYSSGDASARFTSLINLMNSLVTVSVTLATRSFGSYVIQDLDIDWRPGDNTADVIVNLVGDS